MEDVMIEYKIEYVIEHDIKPIYDFVIDHDYNNRLSIKTVKAVGKKKICYKIPSHGADEFFNDDLLLFDAVVDFEKFNQDILAKQKTVVYNLN